MFCEIATPFPPAAYAAIGLKGGIMARGFKTGGRKRIYATAAERQAAYRKRKAARPEADHREKIGQYEPQQEDHASLDGEMHEGLCSQ